MIGFETDKLNDCLVFDTRAQVQGYLDRIANIDKWLQPFVNEMAVGAIPTEIQLFMEPKLKYEFGGFEKTILVDPDDERVRKCVEDAHGIFLMLPDPSLRGLGIRAYPTHPMCYRTLLRRGGEECAIMINWKARKGVTPLAVTEKMDRLSFSFSHFSLGAKVLIRDGVCMVARSSDYAILPCGELVYEVEDMLQKEHPDYEFVRGSASDEFLVLEYFLNEELIEEKIREIIDPGSDKPLRAGLRFSTSDVGSAAACVKPFYLYDNKVFIVGSGSTQPLYMPHTGDASVSKFRDKLDGVGSIFKDNEEVLEKLYLEKVSSVRTVLERVLEAYSGSFPKAQADAVASETDAGPGTAVDVYIALCDIAERAGRKAGPDRHLSLCDLVERLTRLPFDKIDKGEKWDKV